jgi:regulator of replication initiation timing
MLVYANRFRLEPDDQPGKVIRTIATWMGKSQGTFVDPELLAQGIREYRSQSGGIISSRVTFDADGEIFFPYMFCARLTHGQDDAPGRRWITEIGLKQEKQGDPFDCSIVLRTDEISALAYKPIQVTRPKLVEHIFEEAKPISGTPGVSIIPLTVKNAEALAYNIDHESREHPIVIISPDRNGKHSVNPQRLCSILLGLAQVVQIPIGEDTYEIQRIIGRQYAAYGGAINLIYPGRKTPSGFFCRAALYLPQRLAEIEETGGRIESEILSAITHQTNLPNSWKHTSTDAITQAILRNRLSRAAKNAGQSEELFAYEELLAEAATQMTEKDAEIEGLRRVVQTSDAESEKLRYEIEGLKHALSGHSTISSQQASDISQLMKPIRSSVRALQKGEATLEQMLSLIASLYPKRIAVLDSAFASARESDRGGFRYGQKAFDLLFKLAEDYYEQVAEGKGDQHAKDVFGNNAFAAKEAEALSNDGQKRRTFSYFSRDIFMKKHLKHGVKDSLAETLRIHFEWISEDKKIIIGH